MFSGYPYKYRDTLEFKKRTIRTFRSDLVKAVVYCWDTTHENRFGNRYWSTSYSYTAPDAYAYNLNFSSDYLSIGWNSGNPRNNGMSILGIQ